MAETLVSKATEFSGGVIGAIPLHRDSANEYLYPLVQTVPTELGGCGVYSFIGAATTNANSIKASAGQVYAVEVFSIDETPVYVKLYDKATAPTVGTETPKVRVGCPGSATGGTVFREFPNGVEFSTGIAVGVVTGITDASTAALAANEVIVNVYYK